MSGNIGVERPKGSRGLDLQQDVATGALIVASVPGAVTELSRRVRWGRDVEPAWVHAVEVVAPLAGAVLVTRAVTAATVGYIYGFLIAAQEGNSFLLNWTSGGVARSIRVVFGGAGTSQDVSPSALNEGLPADAATNVTITCVAAGGAGLVYQARLLYVEV